MEQQMTMPTQCNKCDEFFDISYDIEEELQSEMSIDFKYSEKVGNFCWNCRI